MRTEVEGLDLDALEKVAREARSSPWTLLPASFSPRIHVMPVDATADEVAVATVNERRNAKFIATFDPPTVLRLLAALRAQAERVRVLEGENEQLRLAICGGEDAPGYAASLPVEAILLVAKTNAHSLREYSAMAFDSDATAWKTRAEAAERRAGELEGAWTWLAARTNLELSHHYPEELDDGAWVIHRVSGGRNDREWEEISTGETPLAAVMAARALLPATQAEREK